MADRRDWDGMASHPAAPPLFFTAFLAAGCAFIVSAKLYGIPPGWVTFVPVALMVAYAASMLVLKGAWLRQDQAGDNIYYLGFLYTLTSLGVSLYQFGDLDSADVIVRNFGIAVASTIAGVAGRVLFSQMRQDPVEVERSARLELAEAARRIRRELDGSVVEMAFFRRQMQQMVEEGLHETMGRFDEAWSHVRDGMDASGKAGAEAVRQAHDRFAGNVDAHASVLASHVAFLEGHVTEIDRAGPGAIGVAEAIREASKAHADRVEATLAGMAAVQERQDRLLADLAEGRDSLTSAAASLAVIADNLGRTYASRDAA